MIEFRTLGAVSLRNVGAGDVDSVLAQPKRLALLAYLALARPRGFHRRSMLLALFWPEDDEKHARWSLNQALSHLRRGLGREAIVSRGTDEVGLDFSAIWSDVLMFEHACDEADPAAPSLVLARCYRKLRNLDRAKTEYLRALQRKEAPETYLRACLASLEKEGKPEQVTLRAEPARGGWQAAGCR